MFEHFFFFNVFYFRLFNFRLFKFKFFYFIFFFFNLLLSFFNFLFFLFNFFFLICPNFLFSLTLNHRVKNFLICLNLTHNILLNLLWLLWLHLLFLFFFQNNYLISRIRNILYWLWSWLCFHWIYCRLCLNWFWCWDWLLEGLTDWLLCCFYLLWFWNLCDIILSLWFWSLTFFCGRQKCILSLHLNISISLFSFLNLPNILISIHILFFFNSINRLLLSFYFFLSCLLLVQLFDHIDIFILVWFFLVFCHCIYFTYV